MTLRPIRRALLTTADKTGLPEFGQGLARLGVELVSTGGTAAALRAVGLDVVDVSTLTGAPEMLDGRVKTLHPAVHGGILARRDDPAHLATVEQHLIPLIDLVVVNLYPFEAAVARGAAFDDCVEEIDIGGPALIRAAAKNHGSVSVITDPADYAPLLERLTAEGGTDEPLRRRLAAKAFARTAAYDAAIAAWFAAQGGKAFPERLTVSGALRQRLRYGENPHQQAAFYVTADRSPGLGTATQLQGKELSFNNIADADSALALAAEFDEPAVVIVKHANPCGAALGLDVAQAYARALACDPTSAFGGIVAANRPLDGAAAEAIAKVFTEVVIAPGADEAARAVFAAKANLRLLTLERMPDAMSAALELKSLQGGFLVQDRDTARLDLAALKLVTRRAPSEEERRDLLFAWTVVKHVRSNAILLARDGATIGIGMGQTSRVDAVELAVRRAARTATSTSCVLASDAFFPFADGLEAALEAGVTAVIQPGGSVRDAEVIAAADKAGIAMLFTGMRHFKH